MKKLLLVLILTSILSTSSWAQCNGVFPNSTVCGNATGASNLPRPTAPSAFQGSAAGTNGQIQYNNSGALGGFGPITGDVGLTVPGAVSTIQPGVVNSGKIATGGVATGNLAANAVTSAKLATNALSTYQTRAAAAALDLSAFTAIQTLGYTTAGDGGGAYFKNVGAAVFVDTYIDQITTPPTRVAGTGYTNGTYNHVFLTGSATGKFCPVTIVVSGAVVSSVSMPIPCVGFAVGDVLTTAAANIGGTGSGFTWTVNAVIGPRASFTDAAGNHWQYIVSGGTYISPLQFGAVYNWVFATGDAAATNDMVANQSAIAFASYNPTNIEAPNAGTQGNVVLIPKGISLNCGFAITNAQTLIVPEGVRIQGRGVDTSSWKECAATTTTNFVGLCNPASTFGEYGCAMDHMQLLSDVAGAGGGTALVYSNSGQQFTLLDTMSLNPGSRGCIKYEIGRGGAANAVFQNIDCEQGAFGLQPTNHGIVLASSGTQEVLRNVVYGCGTAACVTAAVDFIHVTAGNLVLDTANIEGSQNGVFLNVGAGSLHSIKHVTATCNVSATNCAVVLLASTNSPGNTLFETIEPGNAAFTILNGQPSGSNWTGVIRGPLMCVSAGACTAAVP